MNIIEETKNPLQWGEGWDRTRIQDRKPNGGWKKSIAHYRAIFNLDWFPPDHDPGADL